MDDDRLNRLTAEQRDVLRLVMLRLTAKEIAPRLGVTPSAVEGRLKTARHVLGVESSAQAARLLYAHERANADQPTVYGPSELVDPGRSGDAPTTVGALGTPLDDAPAALDPRFDRTQLDPHRRQFPWPFPSAGGHRNELSLGWRLAWPFVILIGLTIGTGLLLNSVATLSQLARAIVLGR